MTYIYTEHDYLAHHGVKGMKWGVRKYQNEQQRQSISSGESKNQKNRTHQRNNTMDRNVNKVLKAGAIAAAAVVLTYGSIKLTPKIANRVYKSKTRKIFEDIDFDAGGPEIVRKG